MFFFSLKIIKIKYTENVKVLKILFDAVFFINLKDIKKLCMHILCIYQHIAYKLYNINYKYNYKYISISIRCCLLTVKDIIS